MLSWREILKEANMISLSGSLILVNTENVPGKEIEKAFGVVSGSTVRSKHFGRDMMARIKNIFSGELKGYTELLEESRTQAIKHICNQAKKMGRY